MFDPAFLLLYSLWNAELRQRTVNCAELVEGRKWIRIWQEVLRANRAANDSSLS